jgi:hypothetical protein
MSSCVAVLNFPEINSHSSLFKKDIPNLWNNNCKRGWIGEVADRIPEFIKSQSMSSLIAIATRHSGKYFCCRQCS